MNSFTCMENSNVDIIYDLIDSPMDKEEFMEYAREMNGELDSMSYRCAVSYVWSDRYYLVNNNPDLREEFKKLFISEHDESIRLYRGITLCNDLRNRTDRELLELIRDNCKELVSGTTLKEVAQEFSGRDSGEFGALLIMTSKEYGMIEVDGYNGESEAIIRNPQIGVLKFYNRESKDE